MTPERPAEQRTEGDPQGAAAVASSIERLAVRLRRLEQQIRVFRQLHVAEVSDLAQRVQTIAKLHADELQLILDELAAIAGELAAQREPERQRESGGVGPSPTAPASPADPAASSPKRARWLAEEERRARPTPLSRRKLLRGRGKAP